jgi:hypothetical protein
MCYSVVHQFRACQRCNIGEPCAVSVFVGECCSRLQRQARFADAACTGQGDQAVTLQLPPYHLELALAAQEAGWRQRQVVPRVADC